MQLWTDLIDPAALSDFGRTIVEGLTANDPLSALLPTETVDDIVFSWNVNEVLFDVAEYRAFDAETPIGTGERGGRKSAELAPLGLKLRFGEYDQLRRRNSATPETVQAAAEKKAARVARAAVYRTIQARAETLLTGVLAINENKFVQTVDYERDPGHTDAAPLGGLWSAAGADPVVDLRAWMAMIEDAAGARPDYLSMSSRAYEAMSAALAASNYVTTDTGVIAQSVVNELFVAHTLPRVRIDDRRIGGQPVIPDDRLILGVAGLAGGTVWGTSLDADEPNYGFQQYGLDAPGLVVGAYKTEDPNTKWIRSDGIALPILAVPDATLSAKVL